MNLNEYQNLSKRTMPFGGEPQNHIEVQYGCFNYALGLNGEAGECADLIKKKYFHGHETTKDEIAKELGDVLHYVAGLASMNGITLEEVATANIEKLRTRYPNGFNTADSIARVDTVEGE